MLKSKIMERNNLELRLREKLRQGFGLYDEKHWVLVLEWDGNVYFSYWSSSDRAENIKKSGFDIQVEKGICYILYLQIEKDYRKRGYGSQLLKVVEDFCCSEFLVKKFQTTPSGISKRDEFYGKRGYEYVNEDEVVKNI